MYQRGFILLSMFTPEIIRHYYALTPIYFWPILWLELRAMGRYLSDVLAAGEEIDGMLCLSHFGTLHIVDLSGDAVGDAHLNAWRSKYNAIPNTLEPLLRRRLESPASARIWQIKARQSVRSRPMLEMRNLGPESLYLDPG